MGYETKLFLCELTDFEDHDDVGTKWAKVIAMVDLCKAGYDSATHKLIQAGTPKGKERSVHIYAPGGDGNEAVYEDKYGEGLGTVDPVELLAALKADIQVDVEKGDQPYRRFVLAAAMIEAAVASGTYHNLTVVTYGH